MNKPLQQVAIGIAIATAASLAVADSPSRIDVMTCTRPDGTTFTEDVYAYTLDTAPLQTHHFAVYLAGSRLAPWINDELAFIPVNFTSCLLPGISMTLQNMAIEDVTSSGVGKHVDGGALSEDSIKQRYTLVTMSYTTYTISATKSPPAATFSAEDRRRSLEAFQTRGLAIPR